MHQDLVKKGYLGLKWPKSYLNRVFYRIVIAIYVPTYPPIFGIKIGKIVVTYPFPIVPLDKCFVVTLWVTRRVPEAENLCQDSRSTSLLVFVLSASSTAQTAPSY